MQRPLLLLLAAFTLAASFCAGGAPYPLGTEVAAYNYTASKLLTDPARPRIYAAVPATNSVIAIDTTTFQVIATIPVGSDPVDLAISMDGTTLYVADSGSTLAAVTVINLTTLTAVTHYALPGTGVAIAAGLDNRVYCSVASNSENTIYQFDGPSGTIQATFNQDYYDNDLFQISPDGKTLFEASTGISYGTLKSFDVSTATPGASPLQNNGEASENDIQLVISHNGLYLCLPSGGGNPGAPSYSTFLISTSNIITDYGSFQIGAYPGPLAFSPDDSLVYQTRQSDGVIDVFSTQTFFALMEVPLPGSTQYGDTETSDIVTDNTGSYLFIAESNFNGGSTSNQLVVITTGSGTLTPPSILPVITSSLDVAPTQGQSFTYQITADYSPTSFGASNLPAGLSVNITTGIISGVPTVNGYYVSQISASNASGTATAVLSLNIAYGVVGTLPVITSSTTASGTVSDPFAYQLTATNTPTSFAATGLPKGLTINASSGLISGVPTTAGRYTVDLSATNAYGSGSSTLALTITVSVPVISSIGAAAGSVGVSFAYQIAATGAPTSFAASGLPAGLAINARDGLISGIPSTAGIYPVGLSATNAAGTATAALTLTIDLPVPVITSSGIAHGLVGSPFLYQLTATNATSSFAASGLPPGLTFNASTGAISGTPAAAGTFTVTLGATNATGTGTATLTLTVTTEPVPVFASFPKLTAEVAHLFRYQVTATNNPTSFSAAGLPPELKLDAANGLISGSPTMPGTFAVSLSAANGGGMGSGALTITVAKDLPVATIVATVPRVTAGSGKSGEFTLKLSAPHKEQVIVDYTIRGTAINGTDYMLLTGKEKFPAGKTSRPIKIVPFDDSTGADSKTVRVTLHAGNGYTIGHNATAVVTIVSP